MIIIRTKHDLATEYLYVWTEEIISEAKKEGFKVIPIEGSEMNFRNFEKRIQKLKPRFVFFNGHGTKSSLYDNQMEELVNRNSSYLLKGTITFARACDSLVELGAIAVTNGCHSYIGYNRKFLIPRWHKTTCKPKEDLAAKPVLESSNIVAS